MKKKILSAMFAVAIITVAGYNLYANQENNEKVNMILANIEALASDEGNKLEWYPKKDTDILSTQTIVDSIGTTIITVEKVTCPPLSLIEKTCYPGIDTLKTFISRYY